MPKRRFITGKADGKGKYGIRSGYGRRKGRIKEQVHYDCIHKG